MTYRIIRMDTLLRECPAVCEELISSFEPAVSDDDVEKFLKFTAKKHIADSSSMTYLAVDVERKILLGYYTLSLSYIRLLDISESMRKKLRARPDSDKEMERRPGTVRGYTAISFLIGQLGRSKDSYDGFGRELLNHAIYKIYGFSLNLGGKVIRIDCKDELIGYYEKSDFKFLKSITTARGNKLNIMVHYIKTPDSGCVEIC